MQALVEKFYREMDWRGSVLYWKDGTLPTTDELDRLHTSAYIYSSAYTATMRAIEAEALLPRCSHCNGILNTTTTTGT